MVRDDDGRPSSSEPTEELQAIVGDDYGTLSRVRRLCAMWELGETSVKKRWRSKWAVGSGLYSPSELSVRCRRAGPLGLAELVVTIPVRAIMACDFAIALGQATDMLGRCMVVCSGSGSKCDEGPETL
ncbi:hypothetical protein ACSQ67_021121 [Phaseolus vulgaris]